MYGQSFALYALSEYFLASQNEAALEHAQNLFNLIEQKAHDPNHEGYRESFDRSWKKAASNSGIPMGVPAHLKTMNTHLHLLEAFTAVHRVIPSSLIKSRINELVKILKHTSKSKLDRYESNWSPFKTRQDSKLYGHILEIVWMSMDAFDIIGYPEGKDMKELENLFFEAVKYRFDWLRGGFMEGNGLSEKIYWTQAEAMVAALSLYRLDGKCEYLWIFNQTFDFVDHNLIDWNEGEWYESLSQKIVPNRVKASLWKAAYHNGRAMINCIEELKALT